MLLPSHPGGIILSLLCFLSTSQWDWASVTHSGGHLNHAPLYWLSCFPSSAQFLSTALCTHFHKSCISASALRSQGIYKLFSVALLVLLFFTVFHECFMHQGYEPLGQSQCHTKLCLRSRGNILVFALLLQKWVFSSIWFTLLFPS